MTARAVIPKEDLKRIAKAMREAGEDTWRVEVDLPNGHTVRIIAGGTDRKTASGGPDPDGLLDGT